MTLPVSRKVARGARRADDSVVLDHEARFLRRRVLTAASGMRFLVDLPRTTSVDGHGAFVLEDGRSVGVVPADEALLEVKGDLVRLAWHVGNRHMPCQVEPGRLLIQRDHVMRDMLERLGADVTAVNEPFSPEGGAYGHGRTHAHAH